MAAQSGHLPWASLLRLEAASLHTEALDFAGAAAIAREELRGPSLTQAGRQRAMFGLAFALLGLGEFDEAYAAFTAPQLVAAAGIEAMPLRRLIRHSVRPPPGCLRRSPWRKGACRRPRRSCVTRSLQSRDTKCQS